MRSYKISAYQAPLEAMDDPTPAPAGEQVLLEVSGCGVCHSDIHLWEGYFDLGGGNKSDVSRIHSLPFTLGHEIVGTVAALGDQASGVAPGDQVVAYPWIGCGQCPTCDSGLEQFCTRPRNLGIHVDGGYADHVLVPSARYLHPVGDLPSALAATYACSGLTAYSALKKVQAKAEGRQLLVIGAGGVGLAALMIAPAMLDAEIVVADIDEAKRAAALKAGAHEAIDPRDRDARKALIKRTGGVPAAIDFVGSAESTGYGFGVLGMNAALVVVGLFGGSLELSVPLLPLKGASLLGSYVGSPAELGELMALAAAGKVRPLPVETRALARADETLQDLRSGRIVGRVVLTP
jgi:D-arabinose 1-dehydrogenase-like Zn-dependent alcohol dehydrogenase